MAQNVELKLCILSLHICGPMVRSRNFTYSVLASNGETIRSITIGKTVRLTSKEVGREKTSIFVAYKVMHAYIYIILYIQFFLD